MVSLGIMTIVALVAIALQPDSETVESTAPPIDDIAEDSKILGRSLIDPAPSGDSTTPSTDQLDTADPPEALAFVLETQPSAAADSEIWDDSAPQVATTTSSPIRTPSSIVSPSRDAPSTIAAVSEVGNVSEAAPSTTAASPQAAPKAPTTTAAPKAATPKPATPTTIKPTTKPVSTKGRAGYIAPSAPTYIPVYDTAWQMLVRSTPAQADNYFVALKANGFSGSWSGIIHHAPATYNLNFAGGGQVGSMKNGELILNNAYVTHARKILDAADRHGMKVGLVAAWQNLYLPGGGADNGVATSNAVRGTITTNNAYAYGRHIAEKFGDHPAVSMWVFGGDAGTNNTEANKAVWREMARGVRDAGNTLSITYHTPTSEFGQLNYAGESWLDFVAPETGHAQDASATESELRAAKHAYAKPVWQGEPRYFNINFDWVNAAFRNPGVNEVRADAQAAENAGVSGYVYGDAGRWTWCAGFGDSTPCNANNVAASFGDGERAVIDVFRN
ncbi:MAG: hypothetical protein ACI81L_000409 [Verrucomicrobiales bacterium]|jgi:hypothetical protein